MGISAVGGSSGFDSAKMSKAIFQKLDANSDGGIDQSEFQSAMKKMNVTGQNANQMFSKIDTNNDGKIDQTENETSLKSGASAKMSGPGGSPPGGAPPGGGPPPGGKGGAGKAGAASSGGSSSSSTKVYDKKDTNKDGVVSFQEELVYELKHPVESTQSQSADSSAKLSTGTQYNQQGGLNNKSNNTQSMINLIM